jgi:prophage antirepressor-like protein
VPVEGIIPFTAKEIIPFDFGKLTMTTIVDNNGNPWWVATEVCKVLGYKNSPDAVARHCKNNQKLKGIVKRDTLGGPQTVLIINESDLYRLITHSHLPAAQEFEKWIMEKVIPSIRKTGSYTLPASGKPMSHVENIARGLLSANFMIEQMKTEIAVMRPMLDKPIPIIERTVCRYFSDVPFLKDNSITWCTRRDHPVRFWQITIPPSSTVSTRNKEKSNATPRSKPWCSV